MIKTNMAIEAERLQDFIGGEFVPTDTEESYASENPTRPSDKVAIIGSRGEESAARAVEAAASGLIAWRKLPGPTRGEHLYRWAAAIQELAGELAAAIVREVGKPVGEARGEVGRCVSILRYYAAEAVRQQGDVLPAKTAGTLQYSLREPLGVVALVTPWNFPLAIPLWKAAPALAVGNTVVLKPAEQASYTAWLLARTAKQAEMPPGVFNVAFGVGDVGAALVRNPAVSGVSFTGSSTVGLEIAKVCAARNIKYQLEMGGKNAAIVAKDADINQAASLVAAGAMRFAGQKCTATSRAIVDRSILGKFMDALIAEVANLPIGDPSDPKIAVGPLIGATERERLNEALNDHPGLAYRLPIGGADIESGYFFPSSVYAEIEPDSWMAQTELFAPVLAVIPAEDLDHAIDIANRSSYGLSASLFTRDLTSALQYVGRIQAGMVRVNADTTGVDPHAPFGGLKGSSSHSREQGPAARDFYTEIKTVQINP